MTTANEILMALDKYARPHDVADVEKFFKVYDGGYSQHDKFMAIKVPCIRIVAKQFADLSLEDIEDVLESPLHEMRLLAVIVMTNQAKSKRTTDEHRKALFDLYLRRSDRINNWDLVDTASRDVIGEYILAHPEYTDVLRKLARSEDLWERRTAMVSTWALIRAKQLDVPYEIAEMLLDDKHDLMHKAVGWMLRCAGDKDQDCLRAFLTEHIGRIPRTALRYAIEHFDPEERQYFLKLR